MIALQHGGKDEVAGLSLEDQNGMLRFKPLSQQDEILKESMLYFVPDDVQDKVGGAVIKWANAVVDAFAPKEAKAWSAGGPYGFS